MIADLCFICWQFTFFGLRIVLILILPYVWVEFALKNSAEYI